MKVVQSLELIHNLVYKCWEDFGNNSFLVIYLKKFKRLIDWFAALRRYEAAGWLRKTVGVVGGKEFPAQPSEEEFRLGLRSGIILCTALNNIQPGAISKVLFKLSMVSNFQ